VINRMRLLPQLNTPLLLHLKASRGGNTGRRTAARADEVRFCGFELICIAAVLDPCRAQQLW
jgi:hypothetical protein